jgi:hypothetical protein
MSEQLKVHKDATAEVVIDFGNFKAELSECRIFANDSKDEHIVFIAQDISDPNKKVQITIKKK